MDGRHNPMHTEICNKNIMCVPMDTQTMCCCNIKHIVHSQFIHQQFISTTDIHFIPYARTSQHTMSSAIWSNISIATFSHKYSYCWCVCVCESVCCYNYYYYYYCWCCRCCCFLFVLLLLFLLATDFFPSFFILLFSSLFAIYLRVKHIYFWFHFVEFHFRWKNHSRKLL